MSAARVGEVREPARRRPLADQRPHDLVHAGDPRVVRVRDDRRELDPHVHAHLVTEPPLDRGDRVVLGEAGDGPDVDARRRRVGDRVDVHAARERADAERRPSEQLVLGLRQLEPLELRDRPGQLVDGVVAELRHRPVGGAPRGPRVEPDDALVGRARVVGGRLRHQHGAGAAKAAVLDDLHRALAAGLLARAQDQLEPGVAVAERGDALRRHHDRGEPALHVARPAAVQPVAVDLAAERVAAPVRAAERHRVEVGGQAERGAVAGARACARRARCGRVRARRTRRRSRPPPAARRRSPPRRPRRRAG